MVRGIRAGLGTHDEGSIAVLLLRDVGFHLVLFQHLARLDRQRWPG